MKYSLRISPLANLAMEEIFDYYSEFESETRAIKVYQSIINEIEHIGKSPFSYKVYENVKDVRNTLRRATVHHTYIIIFEVLDDVIEILNIYHSSRNPSKFTL